MRLTMASSSAMADSKSLMVGSNSKLQTSRSGFADFAFQFSLAKRHADAVAWGDGVSPLDHMGAGLVPHDGVAARQDREGTQGIQTAGEHAQAGVGARLR